jgi:two-component system, cell cycle response regulator
MNQPLLDKILACPSLPTLPAAALEVIELCRREDVHMDKLARTICKDPALALKVLKTVNSAQYALRGKVTTISHALVLLGINTVKTLTLGFTLVGSLRDVKGTSYDPTPIWRRSLLSAFAARSTSMRVGGEDHEEAFLAGLLQDLGILALIQVLGSPYVELLRVSGENSGKLAELERKHLKLDHTEVGEALARKWGLPDQLLMPIRYHESPDEAPAEGRKTARIVALGNKAAIPFLCQDAKAPLDDFLASATLWFSMNEEAATQILQAAGAAGPQLAELFKLPSNKPEDVGAILAQAQDLMRKLKKDGGAKAA